MAMAVAMAMQKTTDWISPKEVHSKLFKNPDGSKAEADIVQLLGENYLVMKAGGGN